MLGLFRGKQTLKRSRILLVVHPTTSGAKLNSTYIPTERKIGSRGSYVLGRGVEIHHPDESQMLRIVRAQPTPTRRRLSIERYVRSLIWR